MDEQEFVFSDLHITEITEKEGKLFESVVTDPICDFCGDVRVRWSYECADFTIRLPNGEPWGSHGGFASCEECSRLIEGQFWMNLNVRVLRAWKRKFDVPITITMIEECSLFVEGFVVHYTPGREPYQPKGSDDDQTASDHEDH